MTQRIVCKRELFDSRRVPFGHIFEIKRRWGKTALTPFLSGFSAKYFTIGYSLRIMVKLLLHTLCPLFCVWLFVTGFTALLLNKLSKLHTDHFQKGSIGVCYAVLLLCEIRFIWHRWSKGWFLVVASWFTRRYEEILTFLGVRTLSRYLVCACLHLWRFQCPLL